MDSISSSTTRLNRNNNTSSSRSRTNSFPDDEAVLLLTRDGTVDHISTEARRILDLNSHPLTGTSIFHRVPPEASFRIRRMLLHLNGQTDGPITSLLQMKTGLGPWQWYKVEASSRLPHDDVDGIILRLFQRGSAARRL